MLCSTVAVYFVPLPCGSSAMIAVNTNGTAAPKFAGRYWAIDNNLAERTLRAVAVGRNNWGVVGSEVGGRTAAVLYSVVGSCKHLLIDPWVYLRECLTGVRLGRETERQTTAGMAVGSLATPLLS